VLEFRGVLLRSCVFFFFFFLELYLIFWDVIRITSSYAD